LNLVKRYLQRDKIMNAISIHEENLTDCLHTFQIVTLMTASNPPDRVETIAFTGLPVSAMPAAASENTLVSDLWRPMAVLLDDSNGGGWDATVVISSMIRNIPALPPALAAPFTQVFDVILEVIEAVKTMREGRDRCTRLMVRVTMFLETLVDALKGKNIDDTKIASSLHILRRNLMAIHADARQWSRLNLVKRYLQRDRIMNAIAIHGENLTACLHTFQIVTLRTVSNPPDRIETIAFPGLPVSARPVAASENTLGSIVAAGLHDFFERPAGHAVFEQIGVAVQGRLEEIGLRATSTP